MGKLQMSYKLVLVVVLKDFRCSLFWSEDEKTEM